MLVVPALVLQAYHAQRPVIAQAVTLTKYAQFLLRLVL
jgi:hypothetical protein